MAILYDNDFGADTISSPPPNTTARLVTSDVTYSVIEEDPGPFNGDRAFRVATTTANAHHVRSFDAADNQLNVRLRTRFRFTAASGFDGAWALCVLRGDDGAGGPIGTGYQAIIADVSGTWHLFLERNEDGVQTVLDDVVISAPTLGDIWRYRFEVEDDVEGNTHLRAWVWEDLDPEPSTPTAAGIDTDPLPAGWSSVGQRRLDSTIDYDFVMIESIEAQMITAPALIDTASSDTQGTASLSVSVPAGVTIPVGATIFVLATSAQQSGALLSAADDGGNTYDQEHAQTAFATFRAFVSTALDGDTGDQITVSGFETDSGSNRKRMVAYWLTGLADETFFDDSGIDFATPNAGEVTLPAGDWILLGHVHFLNVAGGADISESADFVTVGFVNPNVATARGAHVSRRLVTAADTYAYLPGGSTNDAGRFFAYGSAAAAGGTSHLGLLGVG